MGRLDTWYIGLEPMGYWAVHRGLVIHGAEVTVRHEVLDTFGLGLAIIR